MEQLKKYVDDGMVEIAKLDSQNKPQKVAYSELEGQVSRHNKNDKLYKSLEALTWDEKFEWVNLKRLKAKEMYKEGNFNQAMQLYMEALVGIDEKDQTPERISQMKLELKYPIVLNIATCLYKKKQNKRAIEICNMVLRENSEYLPAIYKKVYLLKCCWEYEEAKKLLSTGIKLAKTNNLQKELQEFIQLNEQLIKSAKQNKSVYSKMFQQEDTDYSETGSLMGKESEINQINNEEQNEEEEILYYDDGWNICGKVSRCYKKVLYYLIPSWNPKRSKNKKSKSHD